MKDRIMTGTTRSSDGLDPQRKKLLYRCWHRGTREMDLILGGFADAHIGDLSEGELVQLDLLLDAADADLYSAIAADAPAPVPNANALFIRIKTFQSERDSL